MEYKDLIKNAKANGVASEKAMWQSIDNLNDVLCVIKEEHPELYMAFMRKQHESLYGPHYDRHFADADVEKIRYTNASGEKEIRCSLEYGSDSRCNEIHAVPARHNSLGQICRFQLILRRHVCSPR